MYNLLSVKLNNACGVCMCIVYTLPCSLLPICCHYAVYVCLNIV